MNQLNYPDQVPATIDSNPQSAPVGLWEICRSSSVSPNNRDGLLGKKVTNQSDSDQVLRALELELGVVLRNLKQGRSGTACLTFGSHSRVRHRSA